MIYSWEILAIEDIERETHVRWEVSDLLSILLGEGTINPSQPSEALVCFLKYGICLYFISST